MKKQRGFTLLELMIVVLVIAVLAGIALSSYTKQVRKSRRAESKQALLDMTLRQEKYRSNNATYASCLQLTTSATCAPLNALYSSYTVDVTANSASSYTMTATPKTADQLKDTCGTLSVQLLSSGGLQKNPTTPGCW